MYYYVIKIWGFLRSGFSDEEILPNETNFFWGQHVSSDCICLIFYGAQNYKFFMGKTLVVSLNDYTNPENIS